MASPRVLSFDAEGHPVKFESWLDDLHLFLQLTAREDISLYDHALGTVPAPAATDTATAHSQWQTRDAHARFAIRNSLPVDEREHFGQHQTAQALYTAVVARYSSPALAALGRLSLPYLFPDLSAFHTVADLITHLRTSDARFRAAMPAEFLASNPPPLWLTLYHLVTRLPDSLRTGCSPSPLLPSVASAAAVDLLGTEQVGSASAPSGRRSGKGRRGKGGGGDGGGGGGGGGGSGGGGGGAGGASGSGGGGGGSGGGSGRGGGGGGGGSGRGGGRGGGGRGDGGSGGRGGSGTGQSTQHPQSSQELREWYFQHGGGGVSLSCTYVIRTGRRAGQTCGRAHTAQRCFSRLDDAWRTQFPDAPELPQWADLLKKDIDIYALDFDVILKAMYALTISGEEDQYLCVLPDPGIRTSEAAALGACVSAAPGAGEATALGACASVTPGTTESTEALHTFTLDSGASRCFFRDRTALEPLARPVAVSLADPSGGPDGGVHQFTPAYERVTHCTCARTGRHLATFTRQPGSDLYTLTTESPQVAASASASGQLSAPCSCRSLAHKTVLWHHRLGHPSVQRLRGMHARYLVSGLPLVLPPLPPSLAPPCLPCVEGRQRAAPHSSSFPPTTAPLQTLHMDVWGPARVRGQGQERYFLIVVDDYSRYTTVFPLRTKGEVPDVLIPWISRARLQLRERFRSEFPVLRLHSDRGGEFSSDLFAAYCPEHGIRQSFTLPASPQQNGVAERRIGLVMEVARTSLVHAAAPHFLWPFAVRYAAHQLNLWPRVSLPETSPKLLWTGEVGDASRFRVWGSRAFVRDTSADKLSSRTAPCVFLGFVPDASGWQFYHPASHRVFPSQYVTFDESVPFYRLFPYRTAPLPPPPLFLAPGAAVVDPLPPQGAAPSGVSQVDPVEPAEVAVDSRPARGAEPERAEPERAEPGDAESGGVETAGAEPGGAEPGGADLVVLQLTVRRLEDLPLRSSSVSGTHGTAASGGVRLGLVGLLEVVPVFPRHGGKPPSSPQLREWYARHISLRSGAAGAGVPGVDAAAGAADPGARGATSTEDPGVGAAAGAADPGPGGAAAAGGAAGAAGGAAAAARVEDPEGGASAGAEDPAVGVSAGSGVAARPRPYFVPLLQQVLGQPPPPCPPLALECPPSVHLRHVLCHLRLVERRLFVLQPLVVVSRVSVLLLSQALTRWRFVSPLLRSVSLSRRPPESSLPALADPESDTLRAASPTVTRLLATVVSDPSFESAAASTLVTELVAFAAACRLDYAASLVAEFELSVLRPSGGECALGTDVLEDRQEEFGCLAAALPHLVSMLVAPEGDPDAPDIPTPRSYAEAMAGPYSSQWQSAMDTEMASSKSTGTYVDEVPPPGANIVSGMWIFRVKRPPGSSPVFKARYVARGFSQREAVDFFQTFSPDPEDDHSSGSATRRRSA
ncbi:unnamed protein product [Closterium sp. NIES-65]|nr:unnamed protein product [Closterium sp. NIES-65]